MAAGPAYVSECDPGVVLSAVPARRLDAVAPRIAMFLGNARDASWRRKPRVVALHGVWTCGSVALSCDGSVLFMVGADFHHALHVFDVVSGGVLDVVGPRTGGRGCREFAAPCAIAMAPDGVLCIAERGNARVQLLTPGLEFASFVGAGALGAPCSVAATSAVVVVAQLGRHLLSVFSRDGGALIAAVPTAPELAPPSRLCFLDTRRVCVATIESSEMYIIDLAGKGGGEEGPSFGPPFRVYASMALGVAHVGGSCVAAAHLDALLVYRLSGLDTVTYAEATKIAPPKGGKFLSVASSADTLAVACDARGHAVECHLFNTNALMDEFR